MPRTLYLIRHAETADPQPQEVDLERKLTRTGEADALALGQYLIDHNCKVDLILHSDAIRTMQTAQKINESLRLPLQKIRKVPSIYHASPDALLETIQLVENEFTHVAMIGHNPAISRFSQQLAIQEVNNFVPCMVVCLDFATIRDWDEVKWKQGELRFMQYP